jgi:predicted ATPase/DNA-binding SARP family transcriptional activator
MTDEAGRDQLVVRLLGPVGLVVTAGPGVRLGGRAQAVLAMLALHAGQLVTAEQLIDGVWGEQPPDSVRNALQVHISALRKALLASPGLARAANGGIVGSAVGYVLEVETDQVDALRAERLGAEARVAALRGHTERGLELSVQALGLWAGPALAGVDDAPFAVAEVTRLAGLRFSLVEIACDGYLSLGQPEPAISLAQRATEDATYEEGVWRRLILALYAAGRTAEALSAYGRIAGALRRDLGLDPGPELAAIQAAVLAGDRSLIAVAPGTGHTLSPGEPSAPGPTTALPFDRTPLVGRSVEITELCAALSDRFIRLLTILGPGGSGKTRLAVAAARQMSDSLHRNAVFVDLSAVESGPGALEELAYALGGQVGGADPIGMISAGVGAEPMVVVLDNAEHCAATLAAALLPVLEVVPQLQFLLTSRVALNVATEHRYPIRPLTPTDAAELFTARARTASPALVVAESAQELIDEVCELLDNVPLAVELAAAQLRLVPLARLPAHIQANLLALSGTADSPDRHRTLRATLDGSIKSLAPEDAQLLGALQVFAGGFTMDAACDVAALEPMATLERLGHLVDSSLVLAPTAQAMLNSTETPRFRLLTPVRQYVAEQLSSPTAQEDLRNRHAQHYLRVFTTGAQDPQADADWLGANEELANIDLAVQHLARRQPSSAADLIAALQRRMLLQGRARALLNWAEATLSAPALPEFDRLLLRVVRGQARYSLDNHWPEGGEDFVQATAALAAQGKPSYTAVMGCYYASSYLVDQGRLDEAKHFADLALPMAEAMGRATEISLALGAAQYVARVQGDNDRALSLSLRVLESLDEATHPLNYVYGLSDYVMVLVQAGRADEAVRYVEEGEQVLARHDPRALMLARMEVDRMRGHVLVAQGRLAEAIDPLIDMELGYAAVGSYTGDFGWLAQAVDAVDPELAALILGCADRMIREVGDPDVMPPAWIAGDFEERLRAAHPNQIARGDAAGWDGIKDELLRQLRPAAG